MHTVSATVWADGHTYRQWTSHSKQVCSLATPYFASPSLLARCRQVSHVQVFQNLDLGKLQAAWHHNSQAWMDSGLFDEWVKSADRWTCQQAKEESNDSA